jgi:SAM-dependent methyltransferase
MSDELQQENKEFLQYLLAEYNHPFTGWDFSYLQGRMIDDATPLPWDYRTEVIAALQTARTLLDMGTGGGEFLASLPSLPLITRATEGYKPNIPVARQRLAPLGVTVSEVETDEQLPFEDGYFDLIINRHESYSPQELYRILRPGGLFITQQVGGSNNIDLNELLGGPPDFGMRFWTSDYAAEELKQANMQVIRQQETFTNMRFLDTGAIAYYLKAVPWQISDFSVERYFAALLRLRDHLQKDGPITIRNHFFFIMARKP